MTAIVIATDKLWKKFGSFTAVDDLTMRIEENTVYGFLGPNGSGKTAAIRMMCGLLDPSFGSVNVLGMKAPEEAERLRLHLQVGYMTQRFSIYEDMSVRENLDFLCRIHGLKRKQRATRIAEVIDEPPAFSRKSFGRAAQWRPETTPGACRRRAHQTQPADS